MCLQTNLYYFKEEIMKKFAALFFVMFALFSNVSIASDECHDHEEHCEHH